MRSLLLLLAFLAFGPGVSEAATARLLSASTNIRGIPVGIIPRHLIRDVIFVARLVNGTWGVGQGSATATFTRATTATETNCAGTVSSVADGDARFECNGLLIEGQSTNLATRSEDFSHADWVKTNLTVTEDTQTAPDGGGDAESLTADANNATIIQDLGIISSAAHRGNVYLLRETGTGDIQLTLDNGTAWTTVTINTSTWTRVAMGQTLADPDFGIRIVTSGDEIWVWGGQSETAGFDSSYIPTATATVTRNKDELTFPATDNILRTVGTIAMWVDVLSLSGTAMVFFDARNSSGQHGAVIQKTTSEQPNGAYSTNAAQADITISGDDFVAGIRKHMAFGYEVDNFRLSLDGVQVGTDTSGSMSSTEPTAIRIGERGTQTVPIFGHISQFVILNRVLSEAGMGAL